jgi:aspartyl-tRNA(Asn)/glutamyl-tRNA(Gln) amidotransferase subunit C
MSEGEKLRHHGIDVRRIATLARIHFSEEESESLLLDVDSILEHLDKISTVCVDGVEPSAHSFPLCNVLRSDEVGETFSADCTLMNAPKRRNNQIIVPKVVE